MELSAIKQRVQGGYDVQDVQYVDERVVYCGYLVNHWGHFLIEAVARLWYFLERPENIDRYVFVSETDGTTCAQANYLEFLELLGIADKIDIINRPKKYRTVIVPELSYSYRNYYTDQYKRIFDCVAKEALKRDNNQVQAEKVFFSRSHFPKAQMYEAGLGLLDNYFAKNGYLVVYPEQLGLAEMISIIRRAKLCSSESGSTPHNMLFAEDGQKLIIIERQSVINNVQSDIDVVRKLDVTYVDGHYTIYPVPTGGGPFFLAYNSWFRMFSHDMGYCDPDEQFISEKYIRKCLNHYMKVYRKDFGELLGMEQWHLTYAGAIYEAYTDSCKVLRPFLSGEKPYRAVQYLQVHTIKKYLKRIVQKLRG